jgi:hypothetical protein
LRFAFASLVFDRAWNLMKFGMAMAARMPMMATTIISSMRVKPFFIDLVMRIYVLLGTGGWHGGSPFCIARATPESRSHAYLAA